MSFLIPFLPSLIDSVGSVLEYNKRSRAAEQGSGLRTRGYTLRQVAGGSMRTMPAHKYVHHKKTVSKARRYRGGRVARKRYVRRGKGFVGDLLGNIPFVGPLLGGLASKIGLGVGGRMSRAQRMKAIRMLKSMRGRGLSPMRIAGMRGRLGGDVFTSTHRHYLDRLLLRDKDVSRPIYESILKQYEPHIFEIDPKTGQSTRKLLSGPSHYLGSGLLSPAGGRMRKGHYRYIRKGRGMMKRVYVRKHKVRRGGYMSHTW